MDQERVKRTEQILQGIDDTRVQKVLEDRGYDLDFLDDDRMPLEEQQRLLREQLDASGDKSINDTYLDITRSTASDHVSRLELKFGARADELWQGAAKKIEEDATYIRDVMIPAADSLHKSGNMEGFRDKMQEIEAASVALVSSVNQRQGDVREALRKELYVEAPYVDRAMRHEILNAVTRSGETPNGRLYEPDLVSDAAKSLVELRQTIANRTRSQDDELDILLAARKDMAPRP